MRELQSNESFIDLNFNVKYNTTNPPTVDEVVASLQSLKTILRQSTKFVDAAYKNFDIFQTEILVQDIEAGSLEEWLVVRAYYRVVGEDNHEKLKVIFNDITGDKQKMGRLLDMGAGVVIGASVLIAGSALIGGLSEDEQQVVNNYHTEITNSIVNSNLGLDAAQVAELTEKTVTKNTVTNAVKFIQPAKREPGATISIGDSASGVPDIGTELIKATPEFYKQEPAATDSDDYSEAKVYIHAVNQRSLSGWAGLVPEILPESVEFKLSADVDPIALHDHGSSELKADITVVKKWNKSKKAYVMDHVFINSVDI